MTEYRSIQLTDWLIDIDPENDGVARGWTAAVSQTAKKTVVPSVIQQTFPEYHGVAFYWHAFTPELTVGVRDRLLLRFAGVDYKATVWLNGVLLGENEGGEVPFSFDVTERIRPGENLLAVRVVNPTDEDIDGLNITNVPCRNKTVRKRAGSSLNHGGIWYGVTLEALPAAYLDEYFFSCDAKTGRLSARAAVVSAAEETASLTLLVYDGDRLTARRETTVRLYRGENENETAVDVPEFRLWDVDDPYLYRAELRLELADGSHCVSARVGFRDFRIRDGWFCLNGRKLFIKSAHSGNAFPAGQMLPAVPSMTKQDFYYAKACGFNMLRSIAGLFRKEQLDFCDEIGLLVYEECLASWCLGVGAESCPVGDEESMLRRWDRCTEAMIKRDRNHPSVVIWGLLNETQEGPVFRRAVSFLPRARELDPTRLILLNAGRFDNDPTLGSVSNPGSDRWEPVWGNEGGSERLCELLDLNLNYCAGDFHTYPELPMNGAVLSALRTLGEGSRPVFLSEFGTGSAFDVIDEWLHFWQSGLGPDLEDAAWVGAQSEALMRDWRRFGMESVWPDAEMMLRESQRLNADARLRDFNAIRANPNLCGFSLTGLLDHGMCGEGLWTYWRRFKPEMFDAVSDGWSPLRFCLFVKPHFYAGEPVVFEAALANDGVLKPGVYTAEFAVVGRNGTVTAFRREFTVADDAFAVPVCKETLSLDIPAGEYTFTAFLTDGGAPAGNRLRFYVTDPADTVPNEKTACVFGVEDETVRYLSSRGVTAQDRIPERGAFLVGKRIDRSDFLRVLAAAARGATAVFLNAGLFLAQPELLELTGIADDLRMANRRDWLYHKECVMKPGTVFAAFGAGLVDFPRFGQTFPHPAIETQKTPDLTLCPAFYTGFHEFDGAYGAAHVLCGFRHGAGMLVFNCFSIEENLFSEPAAGLLLKGLLDHFGKNLAHPLE
ncbi:MAG: beta galactosidase jelly roll domain-containing protein [Clostridia bacterium]|nr:beta galactosidase jelly roll domain-containing protein [Clostridia bacterium]